MKMNHNKLHCIFSLLCFVHFLSFFSFLFFFFLLFILFSFVFDLFFFFSLFFFFQKIKRKWNGKHKGTCMKKKIPPTCLKPTRKTIPKPLFSLMFWTTWVSTFWLVMSYKMKERVKGRKRVTMDINAWLVH